MELLPLDEVQRRLRIVGQTYAIAGLSTDWDTSDVDRSLGVGNLRSVEQILRDKAALPA